MTENIQEIPIDIAEEVQDIAEDIPRVEEEILDPGEEKPVIRAKAKGRPKGALNKGPSKPRVKKIQIEESPPAYEPSSPKRNLKLPTDPTSSDIAAEMLKLLQDQTYSRQARKQRLYNSWFQ